MTTCSLSNINLNGKLLVKLYKTVFEVSLNPHLVTHYTNTTQPQENCLSFKLQKYK